MPPEAAPARYGDRAGIAILAAIPLLGLATGYLGARIAMGSVHDAIAARPPIVVLDLASGLEGLSPQAAGEAIGRYKAAAARLAGGGILVLDGQSVLAAPPETLLALGLGPPSGGAGE